MTFKQIIMDTLEFLSKRINEDINEDYFDALPVLNELYTNVLTCWINSRGDEKSFETHWDAIWNDDDVSELIYEDNNPLGDYWGCP